MYLETNLHVKLFFLDFITTSSLFFDVLKLSKYIVFCNIQWLTKMEGYFRLKYLQFKHWFQLILA